MLVVDFCRRVEPWSGFVVGAASGRRARCMRIVMPNLRWGNFLCSKLCGGICPCQRLRSWRRLRKRTSKGPLLVVPISVTLTSTHWRLWTMDSPSTCTEIMRKLEPSHFRLYEVRLPMQILEQRPRLYLQHMMLPHETFSTLFHKYPHCLAGEGVAQPVCNFDFLGENERASSHGESSCKASTQLVKALYPIELSWRWGTVPWGRQGLGKVNGSFIMGFLLSDWYYHDDLLLHLWILS